jgi:hypothetical protein
MNWKEWRAAATAVALALIIAAVGASALARISSHQNELDAHSALYNCQQIELIKTRIRAAVEQSITSMPKIQYYKTHPRELATALANANATLKDFEAFDCYQLPAVKDAGISSPRD